MGSVAVLPSRGRAQDNRLLPGERGLGFRGSVLEDSFIVHEEKYSVMGQFSQVLQLGVRKTINMSFAGYNKKILTNVGSYSLGVTHSSDVAEMPEKLRGKEELQNKEKGKWDGSIGLMGAGAVTVADITNQSWQSLRMSLDSHGILIKVPDIYHHTLELACIKQTMPLG